MLFSALMHMNRHANSSAVIEQGKERGLLPVNIEVMDGCVLCRLGIFSRTV